MLRRFGVSLEEGLLEALDTYVKSNGFANRSQAIRFLVEKNITEEKWHCNHVVAGTVVLMYDQADQKIAQEVEEVQLKNQKLILSSSQYYINENFCLHTVTVMGEAHSLTALSEKLTSIKGIKHGKLVMSRAD